MYIYHLCTNVKPFTAFKTIKDRQKNSFRVRFFFSVENGKNPICNRINYNAYDMKTLYMGVYGYAKINRYTFCTYFYVQQHHHHHRHHPAKHAVGGSGSSHGTIGTSSTTLAGGNVSSASTLSTLFIYSIYLSLFSSSFCHPFACTI